MKKIERKIPTVGSRFERTYAGKNYVLKVVNSSIGIEYELNGLIYKTPTAAAKSIIKCEVNGWIFWHMKKS